MKKGVVLLVFLCLLLPFLNAQKIESGLLDKDGVVKVFVKTNDMLVSQSENNYDIEHSFEQGFSAYVNRSDLDRLAKDGSVEKVSEVIVLHTFLDQSVPLINGTLTWTKQVKGVNLTGAGETICIIDTGVDYTHSDLGGCFGNNNASSGCKVVGGYNYVDDNENPMDDNGHGTHVSGIAAANGSVKGVAPGARIVMIKACNAGGSCDADDVAAGIDWCAGNLNTYNISVISMSIGQGSYSSYCDDLNDPIKPSLDAAVGKNISVIVAAGNGGGSTTLSYPGCLQNATVVGSTTKSDVISSFSNRNILLKLLAPGSSIVSTKMGGGYVSGDGTSMATPHVAGAFAILNQFFRATNNRTFPKNIETIFNNTGRIITDDSTGYNFTRINIYAALYSLSPINVDLLNPGNNLKTKNNQTFSCSATSSSPFVNVSFYLWNSSGLETRINRSITGLSNSSNFSFNFTHQGNYNWNCLFANNASNLYFSYSNFSVSYDLAKPSISIISLLNGSLYGYGLFNVSLNENGSCAYSLNSGVTNISMNSSDNVNFISTNSSIAEANYTVNYYCNDSAGNFNSTFSSFQITRDTPNVTISYPEDGFSVSADVFNLNFSYNVSDVLNITNCTLILNGVQSGSNASRINITAVNNISATLPSQTYIWSVNCTNSAGNIGNSSSRSLTVNAVTTSGSSGGGGGSSGGGGGGGSISTASAPTYSLSEEQFSSGYTREYAQQQAISFSVRKGESVEKHNITVDSFGTDYASITIRSDPIKLVLFVGESRKINLTSSDFYDVLVRLNSISSGKVNMTVQHINEAIPKENFTTQIQLSPETQPMKDDKLLYYVIGFATGILIFLIIYRMRMKKIEKKKKGFLENLKSN